MRLLVGNEGEPAFSAEGGGGEVADSATFSLLHSTVSILAGGGAMRLKTSAA